jgi:hypothetical protein
VRRLFARTLAFVVVLTGCAPVAAQVGAASEDASAYIARVYGSGNEVSAAATAYADALSRLWLRTAVTQTYDESLNLAAITAQICFQDKLDRFIPRRRDTLVTELKHVLAGNPQRYAGYVFAEQLAGQHPLNVVASEREACRSAGVPGPSRAPGK